MASFVPGNSQRNVPDDKTNSGKKFYRHIVKNNPYRYPKNESALIKLTSAFLNCKNSIIIKHPHFCIPSNNHEKVLMVKTPDHTKFLKMVVLENVYDIIEEAHLNSGHGTIYNTDLLIRKQYLIPYEWLSFFVNNCYICRFKVIEKPERVPFIAELCIRAVLDVPVDNGFKYVLVYVDQTTHYSIIRPLLTVSENEVAFELLKIFADLQPPEKIEVSVGKGINFGNIIKILKNIKLPFKLPVINANKYSDVLSLTTYNFLLTGISSMNEIDKKNWVVGIGALQWKINLTDHLGLKSVFAEKSTLKSRYHAHFGVHPEQTALESDGKVNVTKEVKTNIVVCLHCHYRVFKKFNCCQCRKPFHFTCCQRKVVRENIFQSKMQTTCFSCASNLAQHNNNKQKYDNITTTR